MPPVPSNTPTTEELRILHWNIHSWLDDAGGSNVDAVVELVRETEPHVVSLVEVDELWAKPSKLDEVARRCGYTSIFAPTFEYGTDEPSGGFGNALLTKLPVSGFQQRQLTWPSSVYDGSESSEPRAVVFAKVGSLWVGSTHLPRGDANARVAALKRLEQIADSLGGDWVLCGDFNTPADSWLDGVESMVLSPSSPEATYPADRPVEAIDYCLASSDVLIDAKVLPVAGSDHLPLLVVGRIR